MQRQMSLFEILPTLKTTAEWDVIDDDQRAKAIQALARVIAKIAAAEIKRREVGEENDDERKG